MAERNQLTYGFYFDYDFKVILAGHERKFKAYTFAYFNYNNRTGRYELFVGGNRDYWKYSVASAGIHKVLSKFPSKFSC